MNKRGLSNLLTTVLIVFLAIIAIFIVWLFIRPVIISSSEQAQLQQKCFVVSTEILKCGYASFGDGSWFGTGLIKLAQGGSTNLLVAFYAEDGTASLRYLKPINVLEVKNILPPSRLPKQPVRAVVTPIIFNDQKTKNFTCPVFSEIECKPEETSSLCDSFTSVGDIDPVVGVITSHNLTLYNQTHPDCPWINADFNCDTSAAFPDIDPFVIEFLYNDDEGGLHWNLCNRATICADHDLVEEGIQDCWNTLGDPTHQDPDNWCNINCKAT